MNIFDIVENILCTIKFLVAIVLKQQYFIKILLHVLFRREIVSHVVRMVIHWLIYTIQYHSQFFFSTLFSHFLRPSIKRLPWRLMIVQLNIQVACENILDVCILLSLLSFYLTDLMYLCFGTNEAHCFPIPVLER